MPKVGRIITVVLKVQDPKAAEAIWSSHLDGSLVAGCFVEGIASGNLIAESSADEQDDNDFKYDFEK